jgi:hypothetical protein
MHRITNNWIEIAKPRGNPISKQSINMHQATGIDTSPLAKGRLAFCK